MSKNENNNLINQTNPDTVSGNLSALAKGIVYTDPAEISFKDLIAKPEVQEVIKSLYSVPDVVTVKSLRNPFKNDDTKETTQKIKVMGGTTFEDGISFELILLNTTLEPEEAINKKYRLVDYKFAPIANMSGGKFGGYAATGLKLIVTRLGEVK